MAKQTVISNKKKVSNQPFSILYKRKIQISLIIIITAVCYFNILFNDFSFDDQYITENQYVQKGFSGIKDIWTHPYSQRGSITVDYRPLTLTLFAITYAFFGNNPFVGHLLSLLLYLCCIWLLYIVCRKVFEIDKIHPLLPFFIVLLFAVHPSHVETVASFKNRDELVSFIFILLATLFYNKSFEAEKSTKAYLFVFITLIFFYASMLTKLVGIPFIACLFLWSLYSGQHKKYKILGALILSFIILVAGHYLLYSQYLGRNVSFVENPIVRGTDIALRIGLAFNALLFYLKFLFIPFPGRYYYGFNTIRFESIANPLPLLSLLIYILLTGLFVYSVKRKKVYSYYLGAFLFLIFFYSNILIPYTGIVSERAMLHFSFFFIAFLLILLYDILRKKSASNNRLINASCTLYVVFILSYATLTIFRNNCWKNSETLILHDMNYLDNSTGANYLSGNYFYEKSMNLQSADTIQKRQSVDLAIYYYKRSLQLSPENDAAYFKLGMACRYGKLDFENAAVSYLKAAQLSPGMKGLAKEIASLFFLQQKFSEAIPYYETAAKQEPGNSELLFYRALNRYNAKDVSGFLTLNEALLKKFPQTQYPYLNYGTYYFNQNDIPKVVENFETAVKYGCNSAQVLDYLAKYYSNNNNPEKEKYYEDLQKRR